MLMSSICHVPTVSEWLRLLPLLGILALLGYLTIRPFLPKKKKQRDSLINLKIQKENPKVVNEIDIEDLNSANVCYCRCWRSKTVSRLGIFWSFLHAWRWYDILCERCWEWTAATATKPKYTAKYSHLKTHLIKLDSYS